jgi:NAD(P)-dependent dehydrogenase (short-subunit alcohol dehydrogenase family)
MQLKNKTVLVTGASRGIGRAIALQAAKEGAHVIVHFHREKEEAEMIVSQIREMGVRSVSIQADLFNVEEAKALGEKAWALWNGVDILINNAGVCYKKHFLDSTVDDVDFFLNINYKGSFFLTQTITAKMVTENREGSIASITSVNGVRPGLGLTAYGASKAALENLMKSIAMELAPHNIRVNSFAVGAIETDMNAEVRNQPELMKEVNAGIPIQRFGLPEEIAAVVCNTIAADSYLTGATITIDGGLLLMRGYGKPKPYQKPNS